MRTLFVKLFMWFWLAMTLSAMVAFFMAFNMRLGPMHKDMEKRSLAERTVILSQAVTLYGATAAAVYEREGKVVALPADAHSPARIEAYLFTGDGRALSRKVPDAVGETVSGFVQGGANSRIGKGMVAVAAKVRSAQGKEYIAAAYGEAPVPQLPFSRKSPLPPDFWFRFAISFVVGGIVCYGLAWRLASPVRKLREATQRLAAGDLSARVEVGSGPFDDETSGLAKDFNNMADRIGKLLIAQKQLVRDVSHELRSPLARLNVALELARRSSSSATAPALDRIEREGGRLNEMIGEMLTLAQLEGGYQTVEFTEVDVDEVVREIVDDASFEAESSGKTVVITSPGGITVNGDRAMLHRALENVIRNAIRYTVAGSGVEVVIQKDATAVVIRVRDHGPGVPENALTEIFRPFYRVAEARDRRTGGTGIGLAITAQTIQLHRGAVTARNTGSGLEVELRLEPTIPAGSHSQTRS